MGGAVVREGHGGWRKQQKTVVPVAYFFLSEYVPISFVPLPLHTMTILR